MDIRDGMARIANEYLLAKTQPLRDHPLAEFIRDEFPRGIVSLINGSSYERRLLVKGTKSPGNWAGVPWIGILDPRLTDSIQKGIYVVLLFSEDMRRAYLSLAMGVTATPRATRDKWLAELPLKFQTPSNFRSGPLPPGSLAGRGIGTSYEKVTVFWKRYELDHLPEESEVVADILSLSKLLRSIGDSGNFRSDQIAESPASDSVTPRGLSISITAADVERAFAATSDDQWTSRRGVEPYWHVVVGDESKPVKAVFRNLPGIPSDYGFTTHEANSVFEQLGYETVNLRRNSFQKELCLLGTWRDVSESRIDSIKQHITKNGGWASWWSFPIRENFQNDLRQPFHIYINSGGGNFPFRMRVEEFATSRGNEGIPSPWPAITEAKQLGITRQGETNSEVFKSWLRVTSIEVIEPPLILNDFEPPPGVKETSLLNQSAFGYAYLREPEVPSTSPERYEPRNVILYGPPGTGKTHWLRQKLALYTDKPSAVDHDTWLQELLGSYGWRCVIAASLADLGGSARVPQIREHRWIQAKAKQRGRSPVSVGQTIWGYLQEHTPESIITVKTSIRRPPFIFAKEESGTWTLSPDWRDLDDESSMLLDLLAAGPQAATDVIRRYKMVTFHPSFSYEDFVRGIRPVEAEDGTTQFRMVDGVFKQLCDEAFANPTANYAIFIDEINRANIAKVFGELITLIEPDKRAAFDENGRLTQGLVVQLPGSTSEVSEPPFGVPVNLNIYGTMNTADRSIALLDIALRRRFEFEERGPNYEIIRREVEGVDLSELLKVVNERLEFLLDRDHRIGHGYLYDVGSLKDLSDAFQLKIIPLLQEYFFDDWGKIRLVLSNSKGESPFISETEVISRSLFPNRLLAELPQSRMRYSVTPDGNWVAEDFISLYAANSPESHEF